MNKTLIEKISNRGSVCLFGLGKSNVSAAKYLKLLFPDISYTVRCDGEPPADLLSEISVDNVITGTSARENISEDVIILSPSVRPDTEELALAERHGAYITTECQIFFDDFQKEAYVITGSDGKSTTTHLTSKLLSAGGLPSLPRGNFGSGLCELIGSDITPSVELSSFQLMRLEPPSVRACITNITPNHLNWHLDFDEYKSAKLNALKNTCGTVYDFDCPELRTTLGGKPAFAVCSSELDYKTLSQISHSRHHLTLSGDTIMLDGLPYVSLSGAIRTEEYNLRNYMLSLGMTLGKCGKEAAGEVIRSFGGLPHRAECILITGGVRYVNSSIDTSPQRTEKTLFSERGKISIILAGRSKGQSSDNLIKLIKKKCAGAVVMGEIAEEIKKGLRDFPVAYAKDMMDAVRLAQDMLHGDGTVLLSPCATSFDRYKNFEERGEDFRRCVLKLNQK